MTTPAWRVLLIGGASGTGKTRLATRLAARFGVSALLADDVRMAIQHVTTPQTHPALHFFLEDGVWAQDAVALRDGLIGVAEVVSAALEIVIAHHLCVEGVEPLIIEGDGILPSLAGKDRYAFCESQPGRVRAVFLHEAEADALHANMLARGRGFDQHAADVQQRQTQMNALYGAWLAERARDQGVALVDSRPWATLEGRVLALIGA